MYSISGPDYADSLEASAITSVITVNQSGGDNGMINCGEYDIWLS